MSIKINNPGNADLKNNTVWMTSPVRSDRTGEKNNSGSTPTLSVDITSGQRRQKEFEEAMEDVISKNRELYKRLAE